MEIYCPLDQDCVLFRRTLAEQPDVAMLMKKRYCDDDRKSCALRTVAMAIGSENVPEGLFPNQTGRAELLIREYYVAKTEIDRGAIDELS